MTDEDKLIDELGLTGAAQALLADSQQHSMAVVTVRWFVEVLQTPNMLPIFLYILGRQIKQTFDWMQRPRRYLKANS